MRTLELERIINTLSEQQALRADPVRLVDSVVSLSTEILERAPDVAVRSIAENAKARALKLSRIIRDVPAFIVRDMVDELIGHLKSALEVSRRKIRKTSRDGLRTIR